VVIDHNIVTADGLAVDWLYSHLYWTDTGKNKYIIGLVYAVRSVIKDCGWLLMPERIYNPITAIGFLGNVYLSAGQHQELNIAGTPLP
jgi:hypothetical protein